MVEPGICNLPAATVAESSQIEVRLTKNSFRLSSMIWRTRGVNFLRSEMDQKRTLESNKNFKQIYP